VSDPPTSPGGARSSSRRTGAFLVIIVVLAALVWGELIAGRFGPTPGRSGCGEEAFEFGAWNPNGSALGPPNAHAGSLEWYNLSFRHCAGTGLRVGNLTFALENDRCAPAPGAVTFTVEDVGRVPIAAQDGANGTWRWGSTTLLPNAGYLSIAADAPLGADLLVVRWGPAPGTPVYSGQFGSGPAPPCTLGPM